VFAQIKENAATDLTDNCRCMVDSTVSLFFGHGAAKMVSFALLLREMSVQTGAASMILSPMAIGRRINHILGFNSNIIIEFKGFEVNGKLINKVRLLKKFTQEPSEWLPFSLAGDKILFGSE
jgi:hypothetical protein